MVSLRSFHAPAHSTAEADAPVFVLLHGVGLSHRSWSRLARELTRVGRVLAPDLPGFGVGARRRRPHHARPVESDAELIVEWLARARSDAGGATVLVGHSMGVQYALEVALQRPDLVDGLVLVGPVVDFRHRSLVAQGIRLVRDFSLEPLLTCAMGLRDYVRCGVRWYLEEAVRMRQYPTHRRIDEYRGPLLVLRGKHDPVAAQDWCRWLASRVEGGVATSVPTGRHNVVHSHPSETAAPIIDFARPLRRQADIPEAQTAMST
jgi:pimeloyl-ACP methyl ester carboxylesterase